MSNESRKPSIQPQKTPFQRFTVRLVDGRFVRVPKADLPSVESCVDPSATSNQTELRDLFRLVNGEFVRVDRTAPPAPSVAERSPSSLSAPASAEFPDPTFDLPDAHRLPETR